MQRTKESNARDDVSVAASYVKTCKRSDPDFDACVINSVESLRPRLNKGTLTVSIKQSPS